MDCPKCKKSLSVKRTLGNCNLVRRERYCEKCKKSYWSVEMFEEDLSKERESNQARVIELIGQKKNIESELFRVSQGLKAFKSLIDGVCKTNDSKLIHNGLVPCGSCGEEVYSGQLIDGLCIDCR